MIKSGKKTKIAAAVIAAAVVLTAVLMAVFPLPLQKIEEDFSTVHTVASTGELLRISLSKSGKYRIKSSLDEISGYVKKGVVEYEDRTFYFNPGFNPVSLVRAFVMNASGGRILSGGSTITMQVAKLMEPKKRTYGSKLMEIFRAIQLELHYSKNEILEIYLNTIPMGGNIEGIAAASYIYFNKPPSEINPAEAALLIALPKKPSALRPDRHPIEAAAARNRVIKRIFKRMRLTGGAQLQAQEAPVSVSRFINPYKMPHLVNRRLPGPAYKRAYLIEPQVQSACERCLGDAIKRLKRFGVYNGAVIAVNNRTRAVAGYVGSPDFTDKEHAGEIDGAVILRSPGSALKPVIYGLAVDRGLVTPKKILYDIPMQYDGYEPVNFGLVFNGPVTAQSALTRSFNSTAVSLEYSLGKNGLLEFLVDSGFYGMRRRGLNPGLSVALGTYPVTLEELVTIYMGIANRGKMEKPRYIRERSGKTAKKEIFSGEAAYIISEMLADGERPDLPQSWEFTHYRGKIAFKTGTSFGLHDAWCVGYNPEYTVGVWLGNADASASTELVGIKAAAPVVMEIFNALTRHTDSWFDRPAGVKTRKVCVVSGDKPGPYCSALTDDLCAAGRTPDTECVIHRQVYLDKKSGTRVDPASVKGPVDGYVKKVIEDWPPEAASFLRGSGGAAHAAPDTAEGSVPEISSYKPVILNPIDGSTYIIRKDLPREYQKIGLKAATASGTGALVWSVNGKPVFKGAQDKNFYLTPSEGLFEITVQDSAGNADRAIYRVYEK
ncbi:MAG: penicillin-binding protein 1C [Spirochaetia bacterium]|nr:penicillin-binding protein 1C [Spirochaetia bacterium]